MKNEKTTFAILKAINSSEGPLGANALAGLLENEGLQISVPSISRFLANLEQQGYLTQIKKRGRVLSTKGQEHFEKLACQYQQQEIASNLILELNNRDPQKLLDVLITRRALERESVRLAARNASPKDIEEIVTFAEILDDMVNRTGNQQNHRHLAIMGRKFHDTVAHASKNTFLASALDLINQDILLRDRLWDIDYCTDHLCSISHADIASAIRDRNPDAAEKALLSHLDAFIEYIQTRVINEKNPDNNDSKLT